MREPDPEGYAAGTDASIWLYPHGTSWSRVDQRGEWCRCSAVAIDPGDLGQVISLPTGTKIWIAAGITDMRRGFDGLSAQVQTVLHEQPFSGHVFIFRGRRGDIVKCLWFDGDGFCLLAKRLERGRFIWPQATEGTVCLTRAQLSMLLEGIDWRRPQRTWTPEIAV
jgi:transposase